MGVRGCSLDDPLLGVEGGQGVQAQPVHHLEEGPVTGVPSSLGPTPATCGGAPALVWSLQGHSCHTHTTPHTHQHPCRQKPFKAGALPGPDSTHCAALGRPRPSVTRPPHMRACAGKGLRQLPPGRGSSSWESVALALKGPVLREQPRYDPRSVTVKFTQLQNKVGNILSVKGIPHI